MRRLRRSWRQSATLTLVAAVSLAVVGGAPREARAIYPGENGQIVFERLVDGAFDVFVMKADGTEQINITNHPADDRDPVFSADGKKIAFASTRTRNGVARIFVMDATGANVRMVSGGDSDDAAEQREPTWSPDGTKIAFERDREDATGIWVVNADGTGLKELHDSVGSDRMPAWSPNGSRIAFFHEGDVFTMRANGTGASEITGGLGGAWPAWSPDGTKVAFQRESDIYVAAAGGSGSATQLTTDPANDGTPAWSSDGPEILFWSDRGGNDEIYVMQASDGTGQVDLTNSSEIDCCPDWQPITLTVAASPSVGTYGKQVSVIAHLPWFADTDLDAVSIFKTPYGGTTSLLSTGDVDTAGNLSVGMIAKRRTVLFATWAGDGMRPALQGPKFVLFVRVITRGRLSGYYGTSGGDRLYHRSSRVRYIASVEPKHVGKKVFFQIQERTRSGIWKMVASRSGKIGSDGTLRVLITTDSLRLRTPYRMRANFRGDVDHLGDVAPWAYFRLTR
jgi:hypothetical protein